MADMHTSFVDWVKTRRAERLAGDDLFTGEFWTGRRAMENGLIDGIAHATPKLRELYGEKVRLVPFARRKPFLRRFGAQIGAEVASGMMQTADERAMWSRFGL